MSFSCGIIFSNPKLVYVAGQTVSGFLKFTIGGKEKIFNKITVSFKGKGKLESTNKLAKKDSFMRNKCNVETLEDIESILLLSAEGFTYAQGTYTCPFVLKIPDDVPPTFAYLKTRLMLRIKCRIKHTIKVVFHTKGKEKKFKQEIYIIGGVKPRVRSVPLIYGDRRRIYGLNCKKNNIISIKTRIEQSVLKPGDKIKLSYEVINNSNINILTVRIKLMEELTFIFPNSICFPKYENKNVVKIQNKMSQLVLSSGKILRRSNYGETLELDLPKTASSVDFSKIVRKDYFVHVCVVLPCLRRKIILRMPILVNAKADDSVANFSNAEFVNDFVKAVLLYQKRKKGWLPVTC